MQKRLIAVAVTGALGGFAVQAALAQSSVEISGTMYGEYSIVKNGAGPQTAPTIPGSFTTSYQNTLQKNTDIIQTPGSEIAVKGTENLGNGMTAWFQCTSTADFRGTGSVFCARNSALGLQSEFGNLYAGNWDTPYKSTMGYVGGRDTGIFGTAYLLAGDSSTYASGGTNAGSFKRRQNGLIRFDSQKIGGFQLMAGFSSTNNATGLTGSVVGAKPRIWSLAGAFQNGPLSLGAGYEKHDKIYNNAVAKVEQTYTVAAASAAATIKIAGVTAVPATMTGDEEGMHLSAAYTIGGAKIGAVWSRMKATTAIYSTAALSTQTTSMGAANIDTWMVGAEWNVAGPHNIHIGYTVAGTMTGAAGAAMGYRPIVTSTGNDGAKMYQIRYVNDVSKRTQFTVGYVMLKNDANATYSLGGYSATTVSSANGSSNTSTVSANGFGGTDSAVAVSILHKF